MALDPKYKEKIVGLISALYPDSKIYLFGSFAKGTDERLSDIDIAIDIGERLKPGKLLEIQGVLEGIHIPHHIDVVDFHRIPDVLREAIVRERVVWKS